MSKKCDICGAEYDEGLEKCPECSKNDKHEADTASNGTTDTNAAQVNAKEAAAEAAESVKKALKAVSKVAADKAVSAASEVMNSEAVAEVKAGKLSKKTKNIIAALAAAVIAVIVVICVSAGSNTYTTPIDHICKALESGSSKEFIKAYPKFIYSEIKSNEDWRDYYDDTLESTMDSFADICGKNYSVTYTIEDKEKIDKSDLRDIKDNIEDNYDENVKVTAGYTLTVKLKIKGSDGTKREEMYFYVYKIDGKWCIMDSVLYWGNYFG